MDSIVKRPLKVSTKQISIVIVKPVEEDRRKISAMLSTDKYNVLEAANGIDALNLLRKHSIKLIISDAMMPSLDGFRLCFEVRKNDRYKNIKFMIHSSKPLTDNDEELAKKFGVDSFIKDTGDQNEIVDCVNLLLKQNVQQNYPSLESMHLALDVYNKAILKTLKSEKQQKPQSKQFTINRYQSVVNQITDVYYRTDADGIILEISPSIRNFGYEVGEVVGKNVLSFYVNHSEREHLMRTAITIGRVNGYEVNLQRADGVPIVVQVNAQIVKDEKGKIIGVEGVLHDLTDQKKVEKEIKEREKQYRLLFEEAPIAYMSLNENGNVIEENEALRRLIGYSQSEIEGRWFGDFLSPESIVVFRGKFEICKKSSQNIKEEITLKNKGGAEIITVVDGKVIRDEAGRFLRTHCTFSDVTEYRKSKHRLTENENKYKNVFAAGADAMFLLDRQTGHIVEANNAALSMYGYSLDELWKLKSTDLSAEPKKTEDARVSGLQHAPIRYHKRKNGEIFPTEITASYFTQGNREIRVVNIRDISERIFADETIKKSEEQYRRLFEEGLTGNFVSTSSGRVVMCNDAFAKILGYETIEQILKTNAHNFYIDSEDRNNTMNELKRYGKLELRELKLRRLDGKVISIIENIVGRFDDDGELVEIQGSMIDITKLKDVETTLRESELKFRLVVEEAVEIVFTVDKAGYFTYVNPAGLKSSGYSLDELKKLNYIDLIEPEYKQRVARNYFKQYLERNAVSTTEYPFRTKAGGIRWFNQNTRLLIENNDVAGFYVIARDVTERRNTEIALKESEKVLRESEERYHSLFDRMMDGVYRSTHDGRFVDVNPAMVEMFGYSSREEMLVVDIKKELYFSPSDRDSLFLDTGSERAEIFRMRRKDGSEIWVEDHGLYVHDENGNVMFHEGILRNVTERLHVEKALREKDMLVAEAQRIGHLGTWEYDIETKKIYWSDEMYKIYGVDREKFKPTLESFLMLVHSEDRGSMERWIIAILANEKHSTLEFRVIWPDKSVHHVRGNGEAILNSKGLITNVNGTAFDVSERKRAEDKLSLQASALESVANAIVIVKRDGSIDWVNKAFSRLTGYENQSIIGQHTRVLKSGQQNESVYKNLWDTILSGAVWRGELINKRKDGSMYDEAMTITPVRDRNNEITYFIAVKEDITEKKKMETHMLRSQRMESLGTLAGGIAHDLNNVLSPILMGVDILLPKVTTEQERKTFGIIRSSANRGANIVKQVLAFARGIEGEYSLVQPKHIVREMIQLIKETFPKSITVKSDMPKDIWAIQADVTQMDQVLMNLSVNSRDAMPNGGTLSLSMENIIIDSNYAHLRGEAKPGPYVVFTVSDTGSGISHEIKEKIFDPFFTTKEPGKGTGLGLSTVIGIVRSHKGFINLYTELDKGTVFKVYIPAVETETIKAMEDVKVVYPQGNGELILIIDDEASVREILKAMLENYGYQVITANDGVDGLAQFAQNSSKVTAVITDLMMPHLDGSLTIQGLLKMNPKLVIIATSGLITEHNEVGRIEGIVDAFIQKPYTTEKLLKTLHNALQKNKN